MKTPIVYSHFLTCRDGEKRQFFNRAAFLGADDAGKDVVRYFEASVSHAEQHESLEAMLAGKKPRKVTRRDPPHFSVGSTQYALRRGAKSHDLVRVIPAEYIERLDAADAEIRRLEAERRELVEEAFRRGRPLTVAEVEGVRS